MIRGIGPVELDQSRVKAGAVSPAPLLNGDRRTNGINEGILSLQPKLLCAIIGGAIQTPLFHRLKIPRSNRGFRERWAPGRAALHAG
jgi:hypothetical protein